MIQLYVADNMKVLHELEDNSIDSCVTDPPYGISFMNNRWDYDVPSVEFWKEVLRVLKPGAHALVFCGTRTQHRMVVNIEDAGFEIRDVITWIYGQGFPKSMNISKQIDAQILTGKAGAKAQQSVEQEFGGEEYQLTGKSGGILGKTKVFSRKKLEPQTDEAKYWMGWGTTLKPASEFITLIRKPISERTVAINVLKWGTGAINIDSTRIEIDGEIVPINVLESWSGFGQEDKPAYTNTENTLGRWPANLIHDGSDEATEVFPIAGNKSTSRFFYCAKPSDKERNQGLDGLEKKENSVSYMFRVDGSFDGKPTKARENFHPTVKPIALMEHLVKLVTPYYGICLDPFMGSGSTGIACKKNSYSFVGIEREYDYFEIAEKRIENTAAT